MSDNLSVDEVANGTGSKPSTIQREVTLNHYERIIVVASKYS